MTVPHCEQIDWAKSYELTYSYDRATIWKKKNY